MKGEESVCGSVSCLRPFDIHVATLTNVAMPLAGRSLTWWFECYGFRDVWEEGMRVWGVAIRRNKDGQVLV